MKKLLLPFLLLSQISWAQTPSTDSNIKLNTDYWIRKARTILPANHATINDQLTDSKVSILSPKLLTSSTSGYIWTATDNLGSGNWLPAPAGTFQGLTDGPGSYTGNGLSFPRVNTGATALEYRTPSQVLSDISGVPTSRTLTINGTAYDLSADRSWTIAGGVTSFNSRTGAITPQSGDYSISQISGLGTNWPTALGASLGSGWTTALNSTYTSSTAGYVFSSTAPTNTSVRWVDTSITIMQANPIHDYINGAWTITTDECDWWDKIGLIVSKGKPLAFMFTGQSNVGAPAYTPQDSPSYTGDVSVDPHITLWQPNKKIWLVYNWADTTTWGNNNWTANGGIVGHNDAIWGGLGANNLQTFARYLSKLTGRSIRMMGTRRGGQPWAEWENGNSAWTELIAKANQSGVDRFDGIFIIHGEAGLTDVNNTSSFSTYRDSFYDFISRIRAQTWSDEKLKVIVTSGGYNTPYVAGHNQEALNDSGNTSAEGTMRSLETLDQPYTGWASIFFARELQNVGTQDPFHFTTREHEKIGAMFFQVYQSLPRYHKGGESAFRAFYTNSGNRLTSVKLSTPNTDDFDIIHFPQTANGGMWKESFGNAGTAKTTRLVAYGTGSNGAVNYDIWATTAADASSSDKVVSFQSAGTYFAKPVINNQYLSISTGTLNSGTAILNFDASGSIIPASTNAQTRFVATATGALFQSNLALYLANTNLYNWTTTGRYSIGATSGINTANLYVLQPALSAANRAPIFQIDGGAHTSLSAFNEQSDVYFNLNRTVSWQTGHITVLQRFVNIGSPTMAFTGASTVGDMVSVYLAGAPIAGSNNTTSRSTGLFISGRNVGSGVTDSYSLVVHAQTGATTNHSARFKGGRFDIVGIGTTTVPAFTTYQSDSSTVSSQILDNGSSMFIGNMVNQGTAVFGGSTITSGSVALDVQSTTKGLVIPRVTNIASVTNPVNGMAAYDASNDTWNFRQGDSWVGLGGGVAGYTLAAGGTASAPNTFTFNTAGWLNVMSTWAATGNNQFAGQFGGTQTGQTSSSGNTIYGYQFNNTIANGTGASGQVSNAIAFLPTVGGAFGRAVLINATMSATSTNELLTIQSSGTTRFSLTSAGALTFSGSGGTTIQNGTLTVNNIITAQSSGTAEIDISNTAGGSALNYKLQSDNNGNFILLGGSNERLRIDVNGNFRQQSETILTTSTVTAASTTTLTASSNGIQIFTGSTTQTVIMPVATTLVNGFQFRIVNLSSGVVTVQTSGSNTIKALAANSFIDLWVKDTTGGTGTASWNWFYNSSINN